MKRFLIITFLLTIIFAANGQEIVRQGNKYFVGDKNFATSTAFRGYLKNTNHELFAQYNQGYKMAMSGWGLLAFGTAEEQLALLQEMLHNIIEEKLDEFEIVNQMVAAYLEDNRAKVESLVQQSIQDEIEAAGADYVKAYTDLVYTQRNRSWADQITTMLQQENETYFIFAGAAHWLAEDSVFNMLVQDGVARWQ